MDLVVDTPSGRVARPLRRLGKYELFAKIAAGGMAEVYLARLRGPMNFQKAVVVKVIHPQLAAQDEFLRMLFDEARLSALIRHPRVVDIYELGRADGVYFIAMEYLDGEPLSAVMTAGRKGSNLDPLSTARLIADAADGLHAAHELKTASGSAVGLVHRDVSPGNIMVLHDGTAKIVDFGVAKARGRLTVSGAQQFKGKLGYVAPEQMQAAPVDRRADVYGLGVVMWEALMLQRFRTDVDRDNPHHYVHKPATPPSQLRPDIPDELSDICCLALAPEPSDRFQTAGEMRDAIETVLQRAGYYRETGTIRRYMAQVFGEQHEARQRSIRKLAAISHSGEHEIIDADDPEPDAEDLEVLSAADPQSGTEVTHLAKGTPAPITEVTRTTRLVIPALLLVLAGVGGAVAWKYFGPQRGDDDAIAAAAPAPEPAPRPE
ncbi:MAG TPA: serine/threonine-protein kinase, partial [Kofleriaceae bacterium]|nr:serine/threonine-protein kinase [Kofleriaceae bacterium]